MGEELSTKHGYNSSVVSAKYRIRAIGILILKFSRLVVFQGHDRSFELELFREYQFLVLVDPIKRVVPRTLGPEEVKLPVGGQASKTTDHSPEFAWLGRRYLTSIRSEAVGRPLVSGLCTLRAHRHAEHVELASRSFAGQVPPRLEEARAASLVCERRADGYSCEV